MKFEHDSEWSRELIELEKELAKVDRRLFAEKQELKLNLGTMTLRELNSLRKTLKQRIDDVRDWLELNSVAGSDDGLSKVAQLLDQVLCLVDQERTKVKQHSRQISKSISRDRNRKKKKIEHTHRLSGFGKVREVQGGSPSLGKRR